MNGEIDEKPLELGFKLKKNSCKILIKYFFKEKILLLKFIKNTFDKRFIL